MRRIVRRSPRQPATVLVSRAWGAVLDFVFPPQCAACGRDGAHLCTVCAGSFRVAGGIRCSTCWSPGPADPCTHCEQWPPALRSLRAAYIFEGQLRSAVLALKYRSIRAVAEPLVEGVDTSGFATDLDLITAVPMRGRRQRRRGYNQAIVLGQRVARRIGVPFDSQALRRVRGAPPQAEQADLPARRRNVVGAFRAHPQRVSGRRVLVVDDVTTTGATLDACARALLDAGALSVDGWALARED